MKKLNYTKKEIGDLLISILFLGFSFMILLFKPSFVNFFIAFSISVLCYFPREFIQRISARKMNMYSRYRIWVPGVVSAVISSLIGFVFAAPGTIDFSLKYYERYGKKQVGITLKQMGLIAEVGFLYNLILGIIFMAISFNGTFIFSVIAKINFYIAFFNLLPISNLDGVKLIRWKPALWIVFSVVSFGLLIAAHFVP